MTPLTRHIIDILGKILPDQEQTPLHEPFFEGNEITYLQDCIDSRFVSSVGTYVNKFEEMLARFTGTEHAIATVNGTAALHIALLLANVQPEDEVLVPSLTFVGTANAVTYCGATPHFIDSNPETLCLDIGKLEQYLNENTQIQGNTCINKSTKKIIRAIIPVHIFGHPANMTPLMDLCGKHNIAVVEDAAESIGSYYKATHTGNFGIASAVSFNGNKTITTGGGGAILCNDTSLAKKARHLTTTARADKNIHHAHDMIGFNYRMPNINAAIGCAQLEQLPEILKQKKIIAQKYKKEFKKLNGAVLLWEPEHAKSNFWLNTLILDKADPDQLKEIISELNNKKIYTRPVWTPLHQLAMYSNCPAMDLANVEVLKNKIINLPSSKNLGEHITELQD